MSPTIVQAQTQSTAANARVTLKSWNRHSHPKPRVCTLGPRCGGFCATEAEAEERQQRGAAQRLRHAAQTGIKELESKRRIKGGEPNHSLLYSPTSETPCQSSHVLLCISASSTSVSQYCTVAVATGVRRAKSVHCSRGTGSLSLSQCKCTVSTRALGPHLVHYPHINTCCLKEFCCMHEASKDLRFSSAYIWITHASF